LFDRFASCDNALIMEFAVQTLFVVVVTCKSIFVGDSIASICSITMWVEGSMTVAVLLSTMVCDTMAGDVVPVHSLLPVPPLIHGKFMIGDVKLSVTAVIPCGARGTATTESCGGIAVTIVIFGR